MKRALQAASMAVFAIACGEKDADNVSSSELEVEAAVAAVASDKCWQAARHMQQQTNKLCPATGMKDKCLSAIALLPAKQQEFMKTSGCNEIEAFSSKMCLDSLTAARGKILLQAQQNSVEKHLLTTLFEGLCSRHAHQGFLSGASPICLHGAKTFHEKIGDKICSKEDAVAQIKSACEESVALFSPPHIALKSLMNSACSQTMQPLFHYVCGESQASSAIEVNAENASDQFLTFFQGACSQAAKTLNLF